MATVTAQDARRQFSDIINKAAFQKEPVIITRQGKQLAAVISYEDLEYYKKLEDYFDAMEAEKRLNSGEEPRNWSEVKQELDLQ